MEGGKGKRESETRRQGDRETRSKDGLLLVTLSPPLLVSIWGEAGLDRESKVLLGLIRAFLKKDLAGYVGQVSPEVIREVEIKLLRLLGLIKPRHRSLK